MTGMMWFWLAAIVIFGIAEASTVALVSVWFIAGSAVALLAAWLDAAIGLQIILFVVVSAAMLAAFRPLAKRFSVKQRVATNADRIIGRTVKVTESIDDVNGTGAVFIDGLTWTARCERTGVIIPKGEMARVRRIEGVKAIVIPEKEEDN